MCVASFLRRVIGGSVLVALAACGSQASWDTEYACDGQEQTSTAYADGPAGASFRKQYPITIDFHIRSDSALVKSYQAKIDQTNSGVLNLAFKGPTSSLSGKFDPKDNALQLVETRYLMVDGRNQEVHTSGQYVCKQKALR
jgi:hypothetical protein